MSKQRLFDSIYKENYSNVFRICKGYFSGRIDVAKDATQDTFIKVWEHMDDFRQESNIKTWIYRIAVNTCLMTIRKGKRYKMITLSKLPEIEETNYDMTSDIQLLALYKQLETLSEGNRILTLMLLEGLSYNEISTVLGISEDTLRVRISRVKKKLTKLIAI